MRLFLTILLCIPALGFTQHRKDTLYINDFSQKIAISAFLSRNTLQISNNDTDYYPNNPASIGAGITVKNTVLNFKYSFGIAPMVNKEQGKTKALDIQLHKYMRNVVIDLYYQKYKGFYTGEKHYNLFPDMAVNQIGGEFTYVFNAKQFSAKAAFEQSEIQRISAGSFIAGVNVFHSEIDTAKDSILKNSHIKNLQFGISGGYAYNWVINQKWLVSGMLTAGINAGNSPSALKAGRINGYPSVLFRGAAGYIQPSWGTYFSLLIHNKTTDTSVNNEVGLTSVNMQLTFIKRFNSFSRKN